jgi:hypothetical protein
MIGDMPTIRTERGGEQPQQEDSSSSYLIPIANENEFLNSNLLESNRSEKEIKQPILRPSQSQVTDT